MKCYFVLVSYNFQTLDDLLAEISVKVDSISFQLIRASTALKMLFFMLTYHKKNFFLQKTLQETLVLRVTSQKIFRFKETFLNSDSLKLLLNQTRKFMVSELFVK